MVSIMHKKTHKVTKDMAFRQAIRELWEDHIIWTRQVIVSEVASLPVLNIAIERLMQNQIDIGLNNIG